MPSAARQRVVRVPDRRGAKGRGRDRAFTHRLGALRSARENVTVDWHRTRFAARGGRVVEDCRGLGHRVRRSGVERVGRDARESAVGAEKDEGLCAPNGRRQGHRVTERSDQGDCGNLADWRRSFSQTGREAGRNPEIVLHTRQVYGLGGSPSEIKRCGWWSGHDRCQRPPDHG